MTVGLVIVSHSPKIAEGIVDLASQMAPHVTIVAAGGMDDAGLGTSFDKISAAIVTADDGDGVVVLCDLGSAILTAETALDFLDDDVKSRVVIADAPIVEGSVAAAVAAETSGTLDDVVAAARTASGSAEEMATSPAEAEGTGQPGHDGPGAASLATPEPAAEIPLSGTAVLRNPEGLHARPAAEFVRLASTFDARVVINGVDAKSLLRIMSLGLGSGATVEVTATGPQASEAVSALTALVNSGFGE
ncbi:dihydroxyacetone kinase phosphoryl donor subunit DhaM [Glaciihabitans sp. dw_435]|uniref:dihydroxyacetone kinase phosphoryl donor subunit DhaM n=1 Tax=Glaciihabitans sp. dw_435 TaxID=2720081 RepID=UPI001BD2EBB6|nr:dihydroxyacetone kinase phosphoryl donor subunit DhaM [Glaciihabitans sp. dw_435]